MSVTISAKSLIGEPKEKRAISPLAGKLAPKEMLVDVDLLAAEIAALTGREPSEHFSELTAEFHTPYDARLDAPATPGQKAKLQELPTEDVKETELADEPIIGPHWRPEGRHRCWVVCCPAVRLGEPLQDLCGEL